jgi:hypothetical protein
MISDLPLSDAIRMDQDYANLQDPYDAIGAMEAGLPLGAGRYDAGKAYGSNDPSAKMKPKAGGKEMKLPDYGEAVKKMLARNKNRSQMGKMWLDDTRDQMQRFYYADHGDSI